MRESFWCILQRTVVRVTHCGAVKDADTVERSPFFEWKSLGVSGVSRF